MIQIFCLNFITGFGISWLYYDNNNRKKFSTEISNGFHIDGKTIIDGTISSDTYIDDITNKLSKNELYYCQKYPVTKISCVIKEKSPIKTFHSTKYINNPFPLVHYEGIRHCPKYWTETSTDRYIAPDLKLDNIGLTFDSKSIIHYTNQKSHYISSNHKLNQYFIPNNTNITIFGHISSLSYIDYPNGYGDNIVIKFMGPKEDVLSDIGKEYYGISDSLRALVVSICTFSVLGTVYFCISR